MCNYRHCHVQTIWYQSELENSGIGLTPLRCQVINTTKIKKCFSNRCLFSFQILSSYLSYTLMTYLCTQGVLKVRKRVTLMVVTVSAIFVICWGTDIILHILETFTSHKLSTLAIPIAHTMVMFNAAVNPFAYALINQRFREKMKGMICCSLRSSASRVNVAREPQDMKMMNITTKQTDISRTK